MKNTLKLRDLCEKPFYGFIIKPPNVVLILLSGNGFDNKVGDKKRVLSGQHPFIQDYGF